MNNGWRSRGSGEGSYRARPISHESGSSIEYGEKTWTTAQTVRDLMQNHLDAETERYYAKVAETLFSKETLATLENAEPPVKVRAEELLHASFMYAKHIRRYDERIAFAFSKLPEHSSRWLAGP